jgi:hypothetical protein
MDLDSVYLLCSVDKQTEAVHSRSPRRQCFIRSRLHRSGWDIDFTSVQKPHRASWGFGLIAVYVALFHGSSET